MEYLAVYGTLKQGFNNHHYLAGSLPVYKGFTEIPYQMYQRFGVPWLVPTDKEHQIYVEVYKISRKTLQRVEQLETAYQKERIEIEEIREEVFIYTKRRKDEGRVVKNGKFQH